MDLGEGKMMDFRKAWARSGKPAKETQLEWWWGQSPRGMCLRGEDVRFGEDPP